MSRFEAVRNGYTPHDSFRINDLSTYLEVIRAAYQYWKDSGTRCGYPCWLPEFGAVRINPVLMLKYYRERN